MLNISKYIFHLTSNVQNACHISTGRRSSKPNKIKKLMKEYKSLFGALVETKIEKKKRVKLERKGKVAPQKSSEINSELSWVMQKGDNNLRKINVSSEPLNTCTNEIESVSTCTSYSHKTNRTKANFSINQSHVNNINLHKTERNLEKPSRKFSKILKDKSPDQNNKTTLVSDAAQISQGIQLQNSNSFSNLPIVTRDNTDTNNDTCAIESLPFNKNTTVNKWPDIIIKHLTSFPIISDKKESCDELKEILSLSEKDDMEAMKFPSVTKILTKTMPLESRLALDAWKERMIKKLGKEGFDIHQKALLEDGTSLHSCIAQCLLGKEFDIPSRVEPVFKSVQCILEEMHHVKAIETHVTHGKLRYRGIVDCIASYRGENYVIDWKKSDRKKLDLKETYDAPVQIAAYIGAINTSHLYPFVIKRGLLVIAYTCGSPATVHEVCDNTLQHYWRAWLRRLQEYYVEIAKDNDNNSTLK